LNSLAVYRLSTKVKAEVEAFIKGLSQIVPEDLLVNFDENELEVSGKNKDFLVYECLLNTDSSCNCRYCFADEASSP
jgi:predicted methyltransferase